MKMDHFNLLPSVNWNISHMLDVNEDGKICAYGSRGDIVVVKNSHKDDLNEFETKFISKAHKSHRVMGLRFLKVEIDNEVVEALVSCGDDGRIKIWNVESGITSHKCLLKKNATTPMKLVDVDVFPQNNNIVSASEDGNVVKWNVASNKAWMFTIDPKIIINCIAACPHVEDLIAVGAQFGLVMIYSLKGEGKLRHRIRCHDNAVISLAWCPVPYNALQLGKLKEDASFDEQEWKKKDKTLLLASCSKDRSIYVCKAGTNGYCEAVLTLPSKPVTNISRQGNVQNDRGRYLKWIYPSVLLTSTDFNELIVVYMFSKNESKSDSKQKLKLSSVRFDIKPLHNVHKRNISNFAVYLNDPKEVDFRVWSCSADRLLVRSGYRVNYKEKCLTLPLLSGFIFCLDISPVNPDLLAIGTGDGKICLWNLSTENCIDITTLSKKIDNKVMSIKWHPIYEGILAFGTYEGRVGIFDLSQGRTTPTLFKLYHNKPIYKLCWANPTNATDIDVCFDLNLFAVGNGDILQFNPSMPNEVPISLNSEILLEIEEACKCKHKSDLSYDVNRKLVAIGLSNGDVCICSAKTYKLHHTITEQPKAIMSLAWHPHIVGGDVNKESPCSNWLATAGDNVFVYKIDPNGIRSPKKIGSLEIHTNRVLCVAWNPHTDGRLLSCSADNTAIIWDVQNQTILGRYSDHCAQILCGIWSPINKDVAITGSADFTCRMWSVSKDTVNKIVDSKKKRDKIIEPTVFNVDIANDTAIDTSSTSFTKNSKSQTLFPTVTQDFHQSPLLEITFDNAVNKFIQKSNNCVNESETSEQIDEQLNDKSKDSDKLNDSKENGSNAEISVGELSPEKKSNGTSQCNYVQIFGTNDELLNLVLHEEQILESSGNVNELLVWNQARYNLSNKIKEAINKNQVTEQIIALAPSVSPKLWKEACQAYIEQMIKADNIFQAINYQLALGKDDDAIELLCGKNRFKEAFALARLRMEDETVKNILEKWISYCYNCGWYRLGAHCYMYLKEEENACILLNKSRIFKDTMLAIKLLKYYQPKRSKELAIECFKKHLTQLTCADVQLFFAEFPEIKFLQPWHAALKYFKEEVPSTGAITKWLLGMLNENTLSVSTADVDYGKLRTAVVDNTFNMTYEQLMTYVSALTALYVSGINSTEYAELALRNYVRGLAHCYSYRIINSNRIQSNAAYPMMRLLKLMFPDGVFQNFDLDISKDQSNCKMYKSIKAYYCDFVFTWLIQCEELPKSLRILVDQTEEIGDGDSESDTQAPVCEVEQYLDRFCVIRDKDKKLEKIIDLLSVYISDVLDRETVTYFKNITLLKKLENASSSKLSAEESKKSTDIDRKNSVGDSVSINSSESSKNNVETEKSNLSADSSPSQNSDSKVLGDNSSDKKLGNGDEEVIKQELQANGNDKSEIKELKDRIDEFERQRVSAPNPFYFYCLAKEYLMNSKETEESLYSKYKEIILRNCRMCGIDEVHGLR